MSLETILAFFWQLGSFLFVLGVLVFVHELGHFWVARKCGVRVEEFAFGLPPRLWSTKRGDTEYAINAIPFGGYVRMYGQSDFSATDLEKEPLTKNHFEAKTWWQKSLILCAGVTMNMLLAIVILSVGYMVGMKPILPESPLFDQALESHGIGIYEVQKDSIAEKAGIVANSKIEKLNDAVITDLETFKKNLVEAKSKGFSLDLATETGPRHVSIPPIAGSELIGIGYNENMMLKTIQLPPHQAIYYGTIDTFIGLRETFVGFGRLIGTLFTQGKVSDEVTGPVGIFKITTEVSKNGIMPLLQLMAMLSISLAALNILPFPALDGGRLLFVWLEAIFGKKWNKLIEGKVHLIGMALLLLFMISITLRDILKLF
jgi:regulator of sigma E protease